MSSATGTASTGSAVSGFTFRPTGITESDAVATAGERGSVRRCPSARAGLVYYRVRYAQHRRARGLQTAWPPGRKPRNCADAAYLAEVWAKRSFSERQATERWQRTIGQVIARLARVLAVTPLAGSARDLEEISRRYHVSPYFIVAVAATESSIGTAACSSNRRNVWGLSSCGSGWYVPPFASWRAAYEFFAAYVNRQWPGHSTPYSFRGYAACSDCWARKVSSWMASLFGVPAVTRYP
jgi:membrane-bound lytic murein transglycosylase B